MRPLLAHHRGATRHPQRLLARGEIVPRRDGEDGRTSGHAIPVELEVARDMARPPPVSAGCPAPGRSPAAPATDALWNPPTADEHHLRTRKYTAEVGLDPSRRRSRAGPAARCSSVCRLRNTPAARR